MPFRLRRRTLPFAAAMCVAAFLFGCSSSTVPRASYEARLVERHQMTMAQARCTSKYVYSEYSSSEIRKLYDKGIVGVDLGRWSGVGQAMVACTLHDQLTNDAYWTRP